MWKKLARAMLIAAAAAGGAQAEVDKVRFSKQFGLPYLPMIVIEAQQLIEKNAREAGLGEVATVRRHLDADPSSIGISVTAENFPMQNPRAGGKIYIWTLGWNKTAHMAAREAHSDAYRPAAPAPTTATSASRASPAVDAGMAGAYPAVRALPGLIWPGSRALRPVLERPPRASGGAGAASAAPPGSWPAPLGPPCSRLRCRCSPAERCCRRESSPRAQACRGRRPRRPVARRRQGPPA